MSGAAVASHTEVPPPPAPAAMMAQVESVQKALFQFVNGHSALVHRASEEPVFFGIHPAYIKQLVEEYCRFLILKAQAKDTDAKYLLPSEQVDAIWRVHLMDTKNYACICKTLGLSFIHYNPNCRLDAREAMKRLHTTRLLYFQVFGYVPPAFFWGVVSAANVETVIRSNVFIHQRPITIDCGHVDCKCEPAVFHKHVFTMSRDENTNLFWSDHAREDAAAASRASEAVVESMKKVVQAGPHGESFSRILLGRVADDSKRQRVFFARDSIPTYLDALIECPNHCVDMEGSQPFQVTVKFANDTSKTLQVLPSFSVFHVKVMIRRLDGIPVDGQRLIYAKNELENDKTLAARGIPTSGDAILHLVFVTASK